MATFKVQRIYFRSSRRTTLATGLSEEQAQAWCRNPETSSRTFTEAKGRRRTRLKGPWFDSYTEER